VTLSFVLLVVLLALGVPIAFALGIAPLAALADRGIPFIALPQIIFEATDSFVLLAVPLFILSGLLMQSGGIAARLVEVAVALLGWLRGGLAASVVLTSMMFSTISGSSAATAAAVGSVLIPQMKRETYPTPFAAANRRLLGRARRDHPAFGPDGHLRHADRRVGDRPVHRGHPARASDRRVADPDLHRDQHVARLRPGGAVPRRSLGARRRAGAAARMGGAADAADRPRRHLWRRLHADRGRGGRGVLRAAGRHAGLSRAGLARGAVILRKAAVTSAVVMVIVSFTAILAYVLALLRAPDIMLDWIRGISADPLVFLLLVNVMLLLVGIFFEPLPAILILGPLLHPVAVGMGIDPVHFGLILIVNTAIGMVTPPVGANLFISCAIARISMEELTRPLLLFLAVLVVDILIITYVPALSLALLG
jgi:TRAP-type mannitol/chloroaromatic compound transport system permease large subunit